MCEFHNENYTRNVKMVLNVGTIKTCNDGKSFRVIAYDDQGNQVVVFTDNKRSLISRKSYTFTGDTYTRIGFHYEKLTMNCRKVTEKRQSHKGKEVD